MKKYLLFLRTKFSASVFLKKSEGSSSKLPAPYHEKFQVNQNLTLCLLTFIFFFGLNPILRAEGVVRKSELLAKQGQILKSEQKKSVNLLAKAGEAIISVSAMDGVLPHGTTLSVHALSNTEKQEYIGRLEDYNGILLNQSLAFDISLHNSRGEEIQPDGEVTVSFSNIEFSQTAEKIAVYHVENSGRKNLHNISFSRKFIEKDNIEKTLSSKNESRLLTKSASISSPKTIQFQTAHFSVYLIGTVNTATYNFYDGNNNLIETQIVLDGESLLEPNTPEEIEGKKFTGWLIDGTTPPAFEVPVTVSSTQTFNVIAVYKDVVYVYFKYNGNSIATKTVTPGTTTNASGVPLLVTDVGKAFSHWSATPGGAAFDFSSSITENTTLHVVLADLWTVSFNSQGGTAVIPVYVVNGTALGNVTPPERQGYTFVSWNTKADGTGTTYNSSTPINESVTLHAIWTPKTNTQYTVAYWQENANDNNYTYVESVIKTGTTGTQASYDSKTYTGFTLNSTKTNATNVVIAGNGTAVKHVWFDRNEYTLRFYRSGNTQNPLYTFGNIKFGQDISTQWDEASVAYPQYIWATSNYGNTYYSAPPAMPNSNLSVYGKDLGNYAYRIEYRENVSPHAEIKTAFTFEANSGMSLTSEDYIDIKGFTFDKVHEDLGYNRIAVLYYQRNNYKITFNKNNNTGPVTTSNIPYQSDISNLALAGFTKNVTTRNDGYTFGGWYTTEETLEGSEFLFAGETMPANNIILYAKWIAPIMILKAHIVLEPPFSQGGNNFVDIDVPYGEKIDPELLESIVEIPEGYTIENDLLGWYWYVGTAFVPFDFEMDIYTDVEVFPVWRVETYDVTYNLNGGSGTIPTDNNNYYAGANAVVQALPQDVTAPAADQVFTGWKNLATGNIYYPKNEMVISGNVILTAQWGSVPQKTQLTYKANGGSGTDVVLNNLNTNVSHTVQSNNFSNGGYTFAGWNTKVDGSGDYYEPGNQIIVGTKETLEDNTLFAQWAKISLTKEGVFNDENNNGKADVGETITYSFTVKNEGWVPLTNISVSDVKITVTGNPISLLPGATDNSSFGGTYVLTQADINEGSVDNTATVTGYTPVLEIEISDSDSETIVFSVCSLDIECPVSFTATAECEAPGAATSISELTALGFTINDYCNSLVILSNDVSDGNSNPEIITRTYTIFDDLNNNGTLDSNEESITCEQEITIQDVTAPVPDVAELTDATGECEVTVSAPTATDNCAGAITATTTDPVTYTEHVTYTINWVYNDGNGNTASQQQTVVVDDVTAPVPDVAEQTDATGEWEGKG